MLFRNLASMDVEESIRGNPIDGVVLLVGCDKTTPALLMGAASCDLPTIVVSGGPMLNGKFRGQDIGSGTDVWQMSEMVRAGEMTLADFIDAESLHAPLRGQLHDDGHGLDHGAHGRGARHGAAGQRRDPRRRCAAQRAGAMAGRRIVEMVKEDLRMSKILTREAFENAIRVNAAIGGSTNAVIHLMAIAGRIGVDAGARRLGRARPRRALPRRPAAVGPVPDGGLLLRRRPAGGACARSRHLLHRDALTVNGKTICENIADAPCYNREVIRRSPSPSGRRRHRRAARQSRARRRGDQAVGGVRRT